MKSESITLKAEHKIATEIKGEWNTIGVGVEIESPANDNAIKYLQENLIELQDKMEAICLQKKREIRERGDE